MCYYSLHRWWCGNYKFIYRTFFLKSLIIWYLFILFQDVRWFIGEHNESAFHSLYLSKVEDGSVLAAEQRRKEKKLHILQEDENIKSTLEGLPEVVVPVNTTFQKLSISGSAFDWWWKVLVDRLFVFCSSRRYLVVIICRIWRG